VDARLLLPEGFDELEVTFRGYLSHAQVELADGRVVPVYFSEVTRLGQDLEILAANDEPFFAEPGLILLHDISLESMSRSVQVLARRGFFDAFRGSL
jgi:hypothetical protein